MRLAGVPRVQEVDAGREITATFAILMCDSMYKRPDGSTAGSTGKCRCAQSPLSCLTVSFSTIDSFFDVARQARGCPDSHQFQNPPSKAPAVRCSAGVQCTQRLPRGLSHALDSTAESRSARSAHASSGSASQSDRCACACAAASLQITASVGTATGDVALPQNPLAAPDASTNCWVELRGFEPLTPSMRTRCATRLRHSPASNQATSRRSAGPPTGGQSFTARRRSRICSSSGPWSSIPSSRSAAARPSEVFRRGAGSLR